MCTASTHRNFTRRFIAGAVVALALSPVADAYAQGDGPRTAAPAEKISGPKQIGRWAVTGGITAAGPIAPPSVRCPVPPAPVRRCNSFSSGGRPVTVSASPLRRGSCNLRPPFRSS